MSATKKQKNPNSDKLIWYWFWN